jgi:chloramphenicol 3-O-phosphotransferase
VNDSAPVFVISGTQGAGKTTIARLLAESFPRSAHIEADLFQRMIVSGGTWPEERDMSPEARRQLRLRLRQACLVARSFAEAGFTAILDDIIVSERFDHVVKELGGINFYFVMLTPSLEAVRARELGRGTRLFEEWEWLSKEIAEDDRRGLWIDSTDMSPEETVEEILRRVFSNGLISQEVVSRTEALDSELPKSSDGVVLVTGVPGAGKTTVARLLAARFERSAHIETDVLQHDLTVSGLVDPGGEPETERRMQLDLRRKNASLLAGSFLEAGFIPVIDEAVCSRWPLEKYQNLLSMRPLRLVVLAPDLEVIEARDRARHKQVFHQWKHLDESLRSELGGIGLWIDTSEMTIDETVDRFVKRWDEAVVE